MSNKTNSTQTKAKPISIRKAKEELKKHGVLGPIYLNKSHLVSSNNNENIKPSRKRNPETSNIIHNPVPVASRSHLFFNEFALKREAIMLDAFKLLKVYLKQEILNFTTFKQVWQSMRFSYIHYACPERPFREAFITTLYQTFFTFLYQGVESKFDIEFNPLELKLGILFAIYMIYNTNPKCFSNNQIKVDPGQWKVILELYKVFENENKQEGIYVIGKLRQQNAFLFVAYIDHYPFYTQQCKLTKESDMLEIEFKDKSQQQVNNNSSINKQLKEIENIIYSNHLGGLNNLGIQQQDIECEKEYENQRKLIGFLNRESNFDLGDASIIEEIPNFKLWCNNRKKYQEDTFTTSYLMELSNLFDDFKQQFIPQGLLNDVNLTDEGIHAPENTPDVENFPEVKRSKLNGN